MKNFSEEYKQAFKDMVQNHVREENQKAFLLSVYKATNTHSSSTVWGAVLDVAEELFGQEFARRMSKSR